MLFRSILLLLISSIFLIAQEQKVEILAKTLEKEKYRVHAKDEVILYSQKYIITADEAYYNYDSGDLELIGNITIMEGTNFSTRSGYSKLNLKNDTGKLTPMFAFATQSKMWLKCDEAKFDADSYLTKKSIVSSCDVQNPDWKISFTSGEYNRKDMFLSTYNALFYIDKVPVLYLPYFSFPTDKTRRTGLLRPQIGFGSSEGFYYLQPIYFAPQKNWDLQINPQIRTNRGTGIHANLRFADSPYSSGSVSFGVFKEQSTYVEENSLKNDKHYGYSIEYDRSKLFSDYVGKDVEDGLWLDFSYLNDIDYLNTIDNSDTSYDQLVQSTLNYYLQRDLDYFGLYAKYYIDTSATNNDATTQEIPTIQYHRFTNSILKDNIFYSVDYKTTNYTSDEGLNSVIHQLSTPFSIYFSFFDDFLNFKATENFYAANVDYDDGSGSSGGGNIIENYHRLSLYTELAKSYSEVFHTFYAGVDYTIPGNSRKSDGFKAMLEDTSFDELDSLVQDTQENLSFNLVEYFYNAQGRKIVSHSLEQTIILGDLGTDQYKYSDLSNDLKYFVTNDFTIKNTLNYSHEFSRISKFQTSLNWKVEDYKVSFIHTYQKSSANVTDNYLSFSVNTDYVKNYNLFSSLNYDIEENYFKSWSVGWTMKKKCWDYKLTYKEERTPKLTSAGSDSTNKRGIYLMFNLYPIGGVSYDFTKESSVE